MTTKRLFGISIFLFLLAAYILATVPKANAAGSCEVTIASTDAMKFDATNIDISKSCKEFTVNLKHTGKMPKNIMGHNLVIAKASDQKEVIDDGVKAGADKGYIKAKDTRVITATKIIGGGESTSVKFKVSQLNAKDKYTFFCTFPGHSFMMKGTVKLV